MIKKIKTTAIKIDGITAILDVKDMVISRRFYIEVLGFTEAEWGTDNFTYIERDKASIYLCQGAQGCKGSWLRIGFDGDIFSFYEELKAKGVIIRDPPRNYSWALEMHVEDPDGRVLRFGSEPNANGPYLDQP